MAGKDPSPDSHSLARDGAADEAMREWASLFEKVSIARPFLSDVWVREWLAVHRKSLMPRLFRCESQASGLVATALLVPRVHFRGPIPFRQLYLNTDGEDGQDSVIVENNMLLCMPGSQSEAFSSLAATVSESGVHEFIASGIDNDQLQQLTSAFENWSADVVVRESRLVDLDAVRAAGGDLLDLLSANTRGQIRRSLRKYRERGALKLEVARDSFQAAHFFAELVHLHQERWRERGHSGAFATPARLAFHSGFVERAVDRQAASLVRVRAGDFTIGVLYLLTGHGFVNYYQSGFHRSDDPHLKPGLVSHYLAIQHFCAEGYSEYDFLASLPNESRYKASLATGTRALNWLTLSRPAIRNELLRIARRLR